MRGMRGWGRKVVVELADAKLHSSWDSSAALPLAFWFPWKKNLSILTGLREPSKMPFRGANIKPICATTVTVN